MDIIEILNSLPLESNIKLDEVPEIDLYMDQVIQLFESKLSNQKRNDDEKILTKTMINNYAKGKLLLPIKNKKYSKEHIILMSLIYNLKGALSINDIKLSLDKIISKSEDGNYHFLHRYSFHCCRLQYCTFSFVQSISYLSLCCFKVSTIINYNCACLSKHFFYRL